MPRLTTIDLGFQGFSQVIAAYAAPTGDGRFVLFESGPASSVEAVERAVAELGFGIDDLAAIFATHVHLDHSGGAGVLARRTGCTVYAHPAGVAHLIDPGAKLLPSAERLYGDRLVPLWGRDRGRALATAEDRRDTARRSSSAISRSSSWHTPGHAVHHIAWQVGGDVVTGDVGGIRFPGADHVAPPMPPPDIDVELWRESLELIRSLQPERLLLTHYGAFDDPARHLDELEERLLELDRHRREDGCGRRQPRGPRRRARRPSTRANSPPSRCPTTSSPATATSAPWSRTPRGSTGT